jgi:hypothetical protein
MDTERRKDKPNRIPHPWLKALGHKDLPETITCQGTVYHRVRVFKHDFFAATGLYRSSEKLAVYKAGREVDLFGVPMSWLGRWLCRREAEGYKRLAGLNGVPGFLGLVGENAFMHEFVPGHALQRGERVNDEFFGALEKLLECVHARDMAYVDLEKRENILVGDDGRPRLIDFQIAWYWPPNRGGRSGPARWLLRKFQESDRYHLLKHWRRYRPDQLSPAQIAGSRKKPSYIHVHRWITRPFTRLRRRALGRLDPDRAPGT